MGGFWRGRGGNGEEVRRDEGIVSWDGGDRERIRVVKWRGKWRFEENEEIRGNEGRGR